MNSSWLDSPRSSFWRSLPPRSFKQRRTSLYSTPRARPAQFSFHLQRATMDEYKAAVTAVSSSPQRNYSVTTRESLANSVLGDTSWLSAGPATVARSPPKVAEAAKRPIVEGIVSYDRVEASPIAELGGLRVLDELVADIVTELVREVHSSTSIAIDNLISELIQDLALVSWKEERKPDVSVYVEQFLRVLDSDDLKIVRTILRESYQLPALPYAISLRDLHTLQPGTWLNDEVVNSFMFLLNSESFPSSNGRKVYCFTSFLYTKLCSAGYDGVRRWTKRKKIDVFDYDYILFPINLNNVHWTLAAINLKDRRFEYYDSMGCPNVECLNLLQEYITSEHQDKKGSAFDTSEFEFWHSRSTVPQQNNTSDCGMFTIKFAECIVRNIPFSFSARNMPMFRKKTMLELASGHFLQPK